MLLSLVTWIPCGNSGAADRKGCISPDFNSLTSELPLIDIRISLLCVSAMSRTQTGIDLIVLILSCIATCLKALPLSDSSTDVVIHDAFTSIMSC